MTTGNASVVRRVTFHTCPVRTLSSIAAAEKINKFLYLIIM